MIRFLLALLIIYSTFHLAQADDDLNAEKHSTVALPVSEVAYNVDLWLTNSGLLVKQTIAKDGRIILLGTNDSIITEKWLIELSPQSPLGTDIYIQLENVDAAQEKITQLVDSCLPRENGSEMIFSNGGNIIPEPILNQLGNVACIQVQTKSKSIQFTGFFIDEGGLILSTAHDLLEHEHVTIVSNTGVPYEGDIIKADFTKDLALIKVNASKDDVIDIADGRNLLGMGETVFLIGCPVNLRGTIHRGFVNGPPRKVNEVPLWQVEIKIQQGSSGSPVFDSSGTFVAVVKGRHRESEDIGFLIPLEVVVDFLKDYFSP